MSVNYKNERWDVITYERESHLISLKISKIKHYILLRNQSNGKEEYALVEDVMFDYEW